MIYIDASELRENSNLIKYISDVVYKPLSFLEDVTGADLMISPDGLPPVTNEAMLLHHIKEGAKLIQLKFGHDLPSSKTDGRLNEQLVKMLATGAQSWQCLLSFVGTLSISKDEKELAIINGQPTYTDMPMKWYQVQSALIFWVERGGAIDFPLSSGNLIAQNLAIHQDHLNRFRANEKVRVLWPKLPVMYDDIPSDIDPLLHEWYVAQEMKPVKDLRILLCAIPEARIGPEKATAIFEYMAENDIRQDFTGFTGMLQGDKPKLLEVAGIGKKTVDAIRWGLYRTKEEREAR